MKMNFISDLPEKALTGLKDLASSCTAIVSARRRCDIDVLDKQRIITCQRVEFLLPHKFNPLLPKGLTLTQTWDQTICALPQYNNLLRACYALEDANNTSDEVKHSVDLHKAIESICDPATRVATAMMYAIDRSKTVPAVRTCMGIIARGRKALANDQDRVKASAALYHIARTIGDDAAATEALRVHYKEGGCVRDVQRHPACML